MTLGITIAAEVSGKLLLNSGFATQLRPRKYYTLPRETLDALIGDVHELANFFVIETQRIVFVENIGVSVMVCHPRTVDGLQTIFRAMTLPLRTRLILEIARRLLWEPSALSSSPRSCRTGAWL